MESPDRVWLHERRLFEFQSDTRETSFRERQTRGDETLPVFSLNTGTLSPLEGGRLLRVNNQGRKATVQYVHSPKEPVPWLQNNRHFLLLSNTVLGPVDLVYVCVCVKEWVGNVSDHPPTTTTIGSIPH